MVLIKLIFVNKSTYHGLTSKTIQIDLLTSYIKTERMGHDFFRFRLCAGNENSLVDLEL